MPNIKFKETFGNMLSLVNYIISNKASSPYYFCKANTCIYWFGPACIMPIMNIKQNRI